MSAVMSTLSMISGGRRAHRKLASSSGRKSGQLSDAGEDRRTRRDQDLSPQQRSASLQTLEAGGVVNLESLEAKMASIEVSLAGRRRSASGAGAARELDALRAALTDKDALIHNLKKQLSASLAAARLAAGSPGGGGARREERAPLSAEERRALEDRAAAVRAELDARRANTLDLRRRIEKTHVTDNIDSRIQQAELQYQLGREELELLTLGEQARALAQLIEHADRAAAAARADHSFYSTVRECGGSATLVSAEARDGAWGAAPRGAGLAVDWTRDNPALRVGDRLVEVNGSCVLSCRTVEELQRAASAAAPARLVLLRAVSAPASAPASASSPAPASAVAPPVPALPNTFTQNEAASLRAELGSLRAAAEHAQRAKEGLRADNTRLTHRISYLEDQVSELLAHHPQLHAVSSSDSCIIVNKTKKNVTNISISSEPHVKSPKSEVQVFQKGPDITAIVAKLPGLDGAESSLPLMRPRSNASGASSRCAHSPRASPAPPAPPAPRSLSAHSLEPRAGRMRHALSHHCIHAADYSAETDAAIRMIERNQRHMEKQRLKTEKHVRRSEEHLRSDSDLEMRDSRSGPGEHRHYEIKKAADRIEESIKKTNWAERKTLSIIEQLKRSQRLRKLKKNDSAEDVHVESERHHMYHKIDGKVLENAHKSSRRTSKLHSRSAKSSEFESECSDYPNGDIMYCSSPRIDYGSESCSTRLSHYTKHDGRECDVKSRPTPPRKPLRLSLHKARSAHSLVNGSESETPSRPPSEALTNGEHESGKKPVKRTHAGDRWGRERSAGRATPRPTRRLAGALSACEAPAADALYPDHTPLRAGSALGGKWC